MTIVGWPECRSKLKRSFKAFKFNQTDPHLYIFNPIVILFPNFYRIKLQVVSHLCVFLALYNIVVILGMSEEDVIEKELMSLLVQQTWTHSSLCEHIPQCHDLHAGDKSKRYMEPLTRAIDKLAEAVDG